MFSPLHLIRSIRSFQLGYNPWPQNPYPGRWTTPTIIVLFALLTAFIACINVPLSAYEFIQEATYRPNDTLPALPLSRWLPSLLQPPTISFQPQVLTVGDNFNLNNSILDFTLTGAYDRIGNTPVSTFSYFNNPLSDVCDVSDMSIFWNGTMSNPGKVSALIECNFPATRFTMSWERSFNAGTAGNVLDDLFNSIWLILVDMLTTYLKGGSTDSEYTVLPKCADSGFNTSETSICSILQPSVFVAEYIRLFSGNRSAIYPPTIGGVWWTQSNNRLFLPILLFPNMVWNPADVSAIIQNYFQMVFHYLRLQMGVVHPNLIFASADMYNHSILPIGLPPEGVPSLEYDFYAIVNRSRAAMANQTYFAQMREVVHLYNTSDQVPVMEYSRTVPKLKPLGSAITSVFVSTFAMLSTIWAAFSLIAGALAKIYADRRETKRGKELKEDGNADFGVEEQALSEHSRFLNDSAPDGLQDEV
ncbi:hypothetical protein R3P38DRAFT_3263700, partial [Favolaschia claudopus]